MRLDELEISENGPTIFKADNILVSAMNKCCNVNGASGSAKWHFTTASYSILDHGSNYGISTAKLLKKNLQISFYGCLET